MTRVFIAEKPSLADKIAKTISRSATKVSDKAGARPTYWDCGNGTYVTWCYGHMLEQAPPESYDARNKDWVLAYLPIIPGKWMKEVKASSKDQVTAICALLERADDVVNAGDPDREGCLLIDEILEMVDFQKPVLRIWLLGNDEASIKKALGNLKPNAEFSGYSAAAEARGRADWLLGFNFTRGFTIGWKSRGNSGTLHVGRVQTPTLWMVVIRDGIIEAFVPMSYFIPRFDFIHANGTFQVTWAPQKGLPGLDVAGRVVDRSVSDAVIRRVAGKPGLVEKLEVTENRNPPPLPFNLSDLQQEASTKFGYSGKKTLDIAQSLYDAAIGLTTYPRSKCRYLAESTHELAPSILAAVKANMGGAFDFQVDIDLTRKSRAYDDAEVGAHEGIVPTGGRYDCSRLKPEQLNIYTLIVRNFLAQFCTDHVFESTSVIVEAENEKFTAHGKVDKSLGWRTLFIGEADDESDKGQKLPSMHQGDGGSMANGIVEAKKTAPPPRYTSGSLIKDMENAHKFIVDPDIKKRLRKCEGIGTDATRGDIVDQLIVRGYLEEVGRGEKSYYVSTPKARALISSLPDAICRPDLTAYFEELLSQVEERQMTCDEFTKKQVGFVTKLISEISSGAALANMPTGMVVQSNGHVAEQHLCTEGDCKLILRRIPRRDNKKVFFWMCDNKHFYDDKGGKPVSAAKKPAAAPSVATDLECPACGAKLAIRTGKKGRFYACTKYPTCNYTADFKEDATAS